MKRFPKTAFIIIFPSISNNAHALWKDYFCKTKDDPV